MTNKQQNNLRPAGNLTTETTDNSTEGTDTNAVHFGNSILQTETEFQEDKKSDPSKEEVTSSGIDDLQSNSDGAAGTDRAGTAERKKYGDTELNKGLEAQAKDEES